jgi:hypothetical protein
MSGARFIWTGKLQRVRLDPAELPFANWRVAPLPAKLVMNVRHAWVKAAVEDHLWLSVARQIVLRFEQ